MASVGYVAVGMAAARISGSGRRAAASVRHDQTGVLALALFLQ
jgi:hypothetical protein